MNATNQSQPTMQSLYGDMCGSPIVKPIDANNRGEYETGKSNFNDPSQPTLAFEAQSNILQQPGWLTSLFAVIPKLANATVPAWILLFDLTPKLVNGLWGISTGIVPDGAIARYSFGPVRADDLALQGGSIDYEGSAEEVPCRPATGQLPGCAPGALPRLPPDVKGMPFNFGIIAVASSTGRVLTTGVFVPQTGFVPYGLSMSITARMQT